MMPGVAAIIGFVPSPYSTAFDGTVVSPVPPFATGIAPEMEIVGFPATPLPFATAIGDVPMIVRLTNVPAAV